MTEDEINKSVSKEAGGMVSASVGINADTASLKSLKDGIKAIKTETKELVKVLTEARNVLKEMYDKYGLTASYQVHQAGAEGAQYSTDASGSTTQAAGTKTVGTQPGKSPNIQPAPNATAAALSGQSALSEGKSGSGGFMARIAGGVSSAPSYEGNKGGSGAIGGVQQFMSGGFSKGGNFASMAGTLAKTAVQAIDNRVESGRDYALNADRSTLQMQQLTGMSQGQVMNNLRMPLTDYKLGTNGINQLMSLQARTGINAAQQASSVEMMRTISGFSMGAEGASSIIENLAAPETVNKMFMMTGTSLIGPGGQQNSTKDIIQTLARKAGLDNAALAKTASAPGSVTRATLSSMGVSGDLQDQVIQYAQSNIAFKAKGGKGSYDPTKEADRKRMGIDDTFAMEAEETERKRGKRDEQFYRDQAAAYAKLERQTQQVTDALGKFEHALKGIISARTGSRIGQKLLGGMMGAAAGFMVGGPAGAGIGAMGAILAGDPVLDESKAFAKTGYGSTKTGVGFSGFSGFSNVNAPVVSAPATTSTSTSPADVWTDPYAQQTTDFQFPEGFNPDAMSGYLVDKRTVGGGGKEVKMAFTNKFASEELNPALRTSVENMATKAQEEAGIDLRISPGGGRRDYFQQAALFFSRYTPAAINQRTFVDAFDGATRAVVPFNGKNYIKKPQNREPPASAPGDSLHEIGMAADLDLSDPKTKAWVKANLWRFGLASGDGEDYHVQLGWTKNMGVKKFLGETALTFDQASKNARQGGVTWAQNINPGFGVDTSEFSEKLLKRLGTTVTLEKLQWLRAWTQKEGGGGMYNPFNVVSGSNRRTVDGRDRTETNFNQNGNYPVQNFDSLDQGINYTLYHLLNHQVGLMKVMMQPNPSIEDFKAVASKSTQPGSVGLMNNIDSVVDRYNQAVREKDYAGIVRNYGSTGIVPLGLVGDPQPSVSPMTSSPMFIPNTSISSSNMGMSGGNTVNEGSTITISPVINMTSSGANGSISEYDLRSMAKRIAKLIEQETNINKIRST
jgi:hypothetical protein